MGGLSYDHLWKVMLQMDADALKKFCGREDALEEICSRDAFWIEKIRIDFGYNEDRPLKQMMATWKDTYLFMHRADVFTFFVRYFKVDTNPELEEPMREEVTEVNLEEARNFFEGIMDSFKTYGIIYHGFSYGYSKPACVKDSYIDLTEDALTLWLTYNEGPSSYGFEIEQDINWYFEEPDRVKYLPLIGEDDTRITLPFVEFVC